jgi:hypothetical protein
MEPGRELVAPVCRRDTTLSEDQEDALSAYKQLLLSRAIPSLAGGLTAVQVAAYRFLSSLCAEPFSAEEALNFLGFVEIGRGVAVVKGPRLQQVACLTRHAVHQLLASAGFTVSWDSERAFFEDPSSQPEEIEKVRDIFRRAASPGCRIVCRTPFGCHAPPTIEHQGDPLDSVGALMHEVLKNENDGTEGTDGDEIAVLRAENARLQARCSEEATRREESLVEIQALHVALNGLSSRHGQAVKRINKLEVELGIRNLQLARARGRAAERNEEKRIIEREVGRVSRELAERESDIFEASAALDQIMTHGTTPEDVAQAVEKLQQCLGGEREQDIAELMEKLQDPTFQSPRNPCGPFDNWSSWRRAVHRGGDIAPNWSSCLTFCTLCLRMLTVCFAAFFHLLLKRRSVASS